MPRLCGIQVIHSDGTKEDFSPKKIGNQIKQETNISDDLANKIQRRVSEQIRKLDIDEISTGVIRSQVSSQLLKEGAIEDAEKSKKLGMSFSDFEALLRDGCNDNANIGYSPEMIAKYSYDSIAKEYALSTMPKECAEAHISGNIHDHDLEFFNTRPNCFIYNLQFFAKNGLLVDGKGDMGSVAKPAKTLEVLLNHLLQAFMAGAVVFSGGQGLANFNTLLAPFARGRTYEEIKQAIQGFVFNCNMSLICRGGQLAFTSIGMDLSTPQVLVNEPAVGPGGVIDGVYKDYKNEADLIFRAVCEVIDEKDGNGEPHRFPNVLFNIRKGDLDNYDGNCKLLHELGANNPTIYYVNCIKEESTVMGCRTRLPANYSGDYKKDCLNTGNFMYSTLNLPLIALDSEDGSDFYDRLDYYCEIIYDTLKFRREEVEKVLYDYHMSDFLLQKDKETGEPLYDLDRCSYTIGFCGLYECMEILKKDYDVDYDGEDVLKFINEKKNEFFKRDGLRWSVIASPAESTATRFAKINMEKYPELNIHQGTRKAPYLTNSSHIPVSKTSSIIEHIENANKYHKYTGGGNILHLWLGEVYSDPKSMWQLNKKIIEGNTLFWAYSKVFSVCRDCGFTINDKIKECPICKSKNIDWFDRVTGYYLKVKTWIDGKVQEFEDRVRHKIS